MRMTTKLADMVAAILSAPGLARINFTVGRVSVSHADFARVAKAISKGLIPVVLNKGNADSGSYNPATDIFKIPDDDLTKPDVRAVIVHEAVHAINDLRGKRLVRIEDETAAYLAHFMYLRMFDPRFSGGEIPEADGSSNTDFVRLALQMARQLLDRFSVTESQVADLQDMIVLLPTYGNSRVKIIRHNGLKRRF